MVRFEKYLACRTNSLYVFTKYKKAGAVLACDVIVGVAHRRNKPALCRKPKNLHV